MSLSRDLASKYYDEKAKAEKERDEWRARAERAEAALRVVARQTSPDMAMLECAKLAAELAASGATPTCATCFGTGYIAEDHRDNAEAVPCPDCVGKERR